MRNAGGRPPLACAILLAAAFTVSPAQAMDWSGEVGLVSDYRFRGISLSSSKPAVQFSLGAEHKSGAYGSLWGSSLDPDGSTHVELDATAGYAVQLSEAVSADVSVTAYLYPGDTEANAVEWTGSLEANRGQWTTAVGLSVAPAQGGTRDEDGRKRSNTYAFATLEYAFERAPITLRGGFGYERGPWDMTAGGGKMDWLLGIQGQWKSVRLGLDAIGSDAGEETLVGSLALTF